LSETGFGFFVPPKLSRNDPVRIRRLPERSGVRGNRLSKDESARLTALRDERWEILRRGRQKLTTALLYDEAWEESLDSLHAVLASGQRDAETAACLKRIHGKATHDLPLAALGRALSPSRCDLLRLEAVSESLFYLAEKMAPLYLDYAVRLNLWTRSLVPPNKQGAVILFSGRDSIPLMMAYRQLPKLGRMPMLSSSISARWVPFNRFNIWNATDPSNDDRDAIEREALILARAYERNRLRGKKVVVSDWGFEGSIEQIHWLLLDKQERPSELFHFLFFSNSPFPLAQQKVPGGGAKGLDISALQFHRKKGYLEAEELAALPGLETSEAQGLLVNTLQALGCGINECRADALRDHPRERDYLGTAYKFVSLQQMVASYAFLQGVHFFLNRLSPNSDGRLDSTQKASQVRAVFDLILNQPAFFRAMIEPQDAGVLNRDFLSEKIALDVSAALAAVGQPPPATSSIIKGDLKRRGLDGWDAHDRFDPPP